MDKGLNTRYYILKTVWDIPAVSEISLYLSGTRTSMYLIRRRHTKLVKKLNNDLYIP